MIALGLAVIALLVGVLGLVSAKRAQYDDARDVRRATGRVGIVAGILLAIIGGGFLFFSMFFQNSVGEAKVVVNTIDRSIVDQIDQPTSGFKSPFSDFVEFDLFSQQLQFAGHGHEAPSYTGGSVNGKEITVNVGGVNGGSTRADIDLIATYSLGTEKIKDIYSQFRSQERFTEQMVQKQLLSIARQVPANYTAVEFRGQKRGEAEEAIRSALNERLGEYGVEFTSVTIQDVRYPPNVEKALTAIEEANQNAQKAEADKRTAQVNAEKALIVAQGKSAAQIAAAQGEAEANKLIAASLTPEVIQIRKLDALVEASKGGNYIIDNGDGSLLLDGRKR